MGRSVRVCNSKNRSRAIAAASRTGFDAWRKQLLVLALPVNYPLICCMIKGIIVAHPKTEVTQQFRSKRAWQRLPHIWFFTTTEEQLKRFARRHNLGSTRERCPIYVRI